MLKFILSLMFLFFVCACATPYVKSSPVGGYEETRLGKNIFKVTFSGNGYTSVSRAKDFAILRCAEVALENGYNFFAITDSESSATSMSMYVPGSSTSTYSGVAHGTISGNGAFNATGIMTKRTVSSPGVMMNFKRPEIVLMVVAFKEELQGLPGLFDATFVKQSIREKYKIK